MAWRGKSRPNLLVGTSRFAGGRAPSNGQTWLKDVDLLRQGTEALLEPDSTFNGLVRSAEANAQP